MATLSSIGTGYGSFLKNLPGRHIATVPAPTPAPVTISGKDLLADAHALKNRVGELAFGQCWHYSRALVFDVNADPATFDFSVGCETDRAYRLSDSLWLAVCYSLCDMQQLQPDFDATQWQEIGGIWYGKRVVTSPFVPKPFAHLYRVQRGQWK